MVGSARSEPPIARLKCGMKDQGPGGRFEGREPVLSRKARSMAGWSAGAVVVGGVLLSVYAAQGAQAVQAALGTNPGAVALTPASGATSSMPTWSTTTACPAGFQGSAVFRAVKPDGSTFSISNVSSFVTAPFHGTLQGPISEIQSVAGIANGGTEELVVICFSGASLTGTSHPDMSTFITYSANGTSYTSTGVPPTSPAGSSSPSPSGASSGSRLSSPGVTPSGSTSTPSVTPSPTSSSISPAPSPSPVNSNFAVTG